MAKQKITSSKNSKAKTSSKISKQTKKAAVHPHKHRPERKQIIKTHRKHGAKRSRKEKVEIPANDLEQILVERLSRSEAEFKVPRNALFMPEIIYASTQSLRELAYANGFSVGRMLYEKSDKTIHSLLGTMEQAGMGKMLYHIFEESAVITAKPKSRGSNIGRMIHNYEAGIISGFMSASSGQAMDAIETHCISNGNERCIFKVRIAGAPDSDYQQMSPQEVIGSMLKGMETSVNGYVSEEYYLSYMLPLTNPPISEEVAKLMYLAGKSLSEAHRPWGLATASMIKSSFGLKKARIVMSNDVPKTVILEYGQLNSNAQFLSFSQSFIHGLVDGLSKMHTTSRLELGPNNNYILYISFTNIK